jgi:hypothetical protein
MKYYETQQRIVRMRPAGDPAGATPGSTGPKGRYRMAGQRGLVSVSTVTHEAVAGLRARVAPAVIDSLGGLLSQGVHIATETGWHGGSSERWLAEFRGRYEAIRHRVQIDLEELCTFAEASYREITSAGGGCG